ncbi:MAG: FtsQ-type POTRA domain-containing protein [Desulfobacteraceae bacterium]|nr:FtsQ-type POTRA domain-containing protein [Desulfobacteraceae bacterium]MCP4350379.1 FtsQ-type POTRA domain-containing protein [Desulfobacterales bacterium]
MNKISEKEIIEYAKVCKGINILSVNLSAARKKLLSHPWIAGVRVTRSFPSKINLIINEHKPLAILDLDRNFILNTHGEIFSECAASDYETLPLITGLRYSDINIGKKHNSSVAFGAVMNILKLGQQPGSVIPNRLIKKIEVDRETGVTLQISNFPSFPVWNLETEGRSGRIRLGYNNYREKYNRLRYMLSYLKKERKFFNIDLIDLNDINRIVVNPSEVRSEK